MAIEDVASMDLSKFMIAEVRDNVDPDKEGKIAVYIPQLMYEYEYNEKPYEKMDAIEIDTAYVINADSFKNKQLEVVSSNYITARPLSYFEDNSPNWKYQEKYYNAGSLRIPRIGSQVIVIFINSDIQKCYYLPYSPTVNGDKLDSINCCDEKNFEDEQKRTNVDVIRLYYDGMRIEADTNTHMLKLSSPNGTSITIADTGITLNGKVQITGELTVSRTATFNNTVNINALVTCKESLAVQGTITNKGKNLSTHIHFTDDGSTSGPI